MLDEFESKRAWIGTYKGQYSVPHSSDDEVEHAV